VPSSAIGRKRTFENTDFGLLECPLWGRPTLSDQREGLNLDLHVILIARPRYQDLAVYMQPTKKPLFDEAFCVSAYVREKGNLLRGAQHAILMP
jgi:hypothetical protein